VKECELFAAAICQQGGLEFPPCPRVAVSTGALIYEKGAKRGQGSDGTFTLNEDVFEELVGKEDAQRLTIEIGLVSDIIEALLEHDEVCGYRAACYIQLLHTTATA
jgi:hypothetical protein